jgi:DnaJ like chaperone protein
MRWNGKIIGVIIGLLSGHLIGVVIGLVVGHLWDIGFFNRIIQKNLTQGAQHIQHVFFDTTFSMMGFLAKADGRVSESEIRIAENIMQQMELSSQMRLEAIRLFNQGKQPDFDWISSMSKLKSACWQNPHLLRTFLEMQIQIAGAEGQISSGKWNALQNICAELGVRGMMFDQFARQSHYQQSYQQSYHRPAGVEPLAEAYQILNLDSTVSDTEVKKAYRRLLSQNHPDKLMSQGLPPEMIKLANERTQKIKKAYETIKKSREQVHG